MFTALILSGVHSEVWNRLKHGDAWMAFLKNDGLVQSPYGDIARAGVDSPPGYDPLVLGSAESFRISGIRISGILVYGDREGKGAVLSSRHLLKESFRRINISLSAEHELNRLPFFIDGTVEMFACLPDFDVPPWSGTRWVTSSRASLTKVLAAGSGFGVRLRKTLGEGDRPRHISARGGVILRSYLDRYRGSVKGSIREEMIAKKPYSFLMENSLG